MTTEIRGLLPAEAALPLVEHEVTTDIVIIVKLAGTGGEVTTKGHEHVVQRNQPVGK